MANRPAPTKERVLQAMAALRNPANVRQIAAWAEVSLRAAQEAIKDLRQAGMVCNAGYAPDSTGRKQLTYRRVAA